MLVHTATPWSIDQIRYFYTHQVYTREEETLYIAWNSRRSRVNLSMQNFDPLLVSKPANCPLAISSPSFSTRPISESSFFIIFIFSLRRQCFDSFLTNVYIIALFSSRPFLLLNLLRPVLLNKLAPISICKFAFVFAFVIVLLVLSTCVKREPQTFMKYQKNI